MFLLKRQLWRPVGRQLLEPILMDHRINDKVSVHGLEHQYQLMSQLIKVTVFLSNWSLTTNIVTLEKKMNITQIPYCKTYP